MRPAVRGVAWAFAGGMLLAAPSGEEAGAARVLRDARHLATAFHPRAIDHPEHLQRASAWIAEAFSLAGARVSFQTFMVNGVAYRNVLAQVGPMDGPRVVLGAHYDAVAISPGADDNASGVAVLLEVARHLRQAAPAQTVELVAYVNEEPPAFRTAAMGSVQHARRLKAEGVDVRAMVSVDMVGDYAPGRRPQGAFRALGPHTLGVVAEPSQRALVAILVRSLGGTLAPLTRVVPVLAARTVPGIDWSDHHPFWDVGYPAVMVTSGGWERSEAYHSPKDTPDRLDGLRMARLAEALSRWAKGSETK